MNLGWAEEEGVPGAYKGWGAVGEEEEVIEGHEEWMMHPAGPAREFREEIGVISEGP